MPADSAKYATTMAQSMAVRFMGSGIGVGCGIRTLNSRLLSTTLLRGRRDDRHDSIGECDSNAPDPVVRARRVHAIAEQDDKHIPLRIDPDRRAGESGVPERRGR